MITALQEFDEAIRTIREQSELYNYLDNTLHLPFEYSAEILRSQLVCTVSAMDRFFHEIVRIGFLESYKGIRKPTDKFKMWQFSNERVLLIVQYSNPAHVPTAAQETAEYLVEQDVVRKLSLLAYQHPDKIKDALSYVWLEHHKMQTLASAMGLPPANGQQMLEQKLKLICERRNQIVHEGDIEPTTRTRRTICQTDVLDNVNFIEAFCHSVYSYVTAPTCYV